jgi:group II intron reverse transcriptase/maturase
MLESSDPRPAPLLEQVADAENMNRAWKRVKRNKGAAGVDGRDLAKTEAFLRENGDDIRRRIVEGTYQPMPVLRVEIPKPGGGVRKLGIPTVLDRIVQQAIVQVLTPRLDPGFSESSFGYRPGCSAHDALRHALTHQEEGRQWVVDLDLKSFFDEVDHDILMSRLGRTVKDKELKRLIAAFLRSGVCVNGEIQPTDKGTPQGGPLSPLLSNVLLDDLDKELESRGLAFARYADDCTIFVRSRRAGERVMASVTRYVEGPLKLKVNQQKSRVARPWKVTFLGLTFRKIRGKMRICIPEEAWKAFRRKVRTLFRPGRGQNLRAFITRTLNPVLRGWLGYYGIGAAKQALRTHDFWIRRRLRCLLWRQWGRPMVKFRKLVTLGCTRQQACVANSRYGPWWCAGTPQLRQALSPSYFQEQKLFSLLEDVLKREQHQQRNRRDTDPYVRWCEGWGT